MKKFKQGDYVYIPSNVRLFRFEKNKPQHFPDFKETKTTEEPKHLMFVNKVDDSWIRVFYNGELWSVNEENVYEIEEAQ
tara:strand:- start:984 stop:1220 length:237 start_codon:yes stop_codon:yes gene_type:complete